MGTGKAFVRVGRKASVVTSEEVGFGRGQQTVAVATIGGVTYRSKRVPFAHFGAACDSLLATVRTAHPTAKLVVD